MLVLGLVLVAAGAVVLLLGLVTVSDNGADPASFIGLDLGAMTIFVLGFVSGLLLMLGFALSKWGGKRQLRQSKERRRLEGLAHQLEEERRRTSSPEDGTTER